MRFPTAILTVLFLFCPLTQAATSVSQWGITWTFDKDYPTGQFVNGDYWVVGPVKIVSISTNLHAEGFKPEPGQDGSMLNPGTNSKQGYDNRLGSYDASLNAGLINGKPIAADNVLEIKPGSSLVSMVSWLYRSAEDAEPGMPRMNGGTNQPRPVTRTGAVLTILDKEPAKNAFRPPYVGADKSIKYTLDNIDRTKLPKLDPVDNTPNPAELAKRIERPWIDHVHEFLGAMVHPSENMPNYGRDMGLTMAQVSLLLLVDFDKLDGKPNKDQLLIPFLQYGIDLAGIADNGGGWPANGGHQMGRKWPILFAGVVFNDAHLKDVGNWKTRFQEDEQTFIVTQAAVDITNSDKWNPDKRGAPEPYTKDDIGTPEWGIRHATKPEADNKSWTATYRHINGPVMAGFVLAARLMDQEKAWNHPPLFAYTDRWVKLSGEGKKAGWPKFVESMWRAHEKPAAK